MRNGHFFVEEVFYKNSTRLSFSMASSYTSLGLNQTLGLVARRATKYNNNRPLKRMDVNPLYLRGTKVKIEEFGTSAFVPIMYPRGMEWS